MVLQVVFPLTQNSENHWEGHGMPDHGLAILVEDHVVCAFVDQGKQSVIGKGTNSIGKQKDQYHASEDDTQAGVRLHT